MARGPGRPSKLTPETKEKLFKALRTGAHIETACNAAGVAYVTVATWNQIAEGTHPTRKATPEYVEFREEMQRAIAEAEMILVARVNAASKEDWRASAWMLDRRHPERWASTHKVRIEAEKQVEAQFDLYFQTVMDDDSIPTEVKQRLIDHACNLQSRAEVAGKN